MRKILVILTLALMIAGCSSDSTSKNDDAGTSDTDTDTDVDTDSDTDTDTDTDSDTDTDTDTDIDAGPDGGDTDTEPDGNYMFVTSIDVVAGAFGGVAGADSVCQTRAGIAGFTGNYIAWLSTSTEDMVDRLTATGARGWVRPDGLSFADEVLDIVNGKIFYPPMIDELGNRVPDNQPVVTGTMSTGVLASSGSCSDYSVTTGTIMVGLADNGTVNWTSESTLSCGGAARLYCFGTDNNEEVAPVPQAGRRAFVTTASLSPGSGLTGADGLCSTQASAAGLTGTYLALIAVSGASAASRFNDTGGNWSRIDDVLLAGSAADLLAGDPMWAPINLGANGTSYLGNSMVWTGALGIELNGNLHCASWNANSSSNNGNRGRICSASEQSFDYGAVPCSVTSGNIYCLEQ